MFPWKRFQTEVYKFFQEVEFVGMSNYHMYIELCGTSKFSK